MNSILYKDIPSYSKIIDVRSNSRYLMGHIPNAISIEGITLLGNPNKYLKKNEKYYLYCESGSTSKMVVEKLNRMGFHTVNIIGGYHNYLLRK